MSEDMYIGVSSNFRHKLNIKCTNASVKCLGIYINKNKIKVTNDDITAKLEKIEHIIKIWSCRNVSWKGKISYKHVPI